MSLVQKVVGVTFNDREAAIRNLSPGDEVLLVPEDSNPYDDKAVRVQDGGGRCLGYISRSTNVRVRHHIAQYGNVGRVYEVGVPPHQYLTLKVLMPGAMPL